MEHTTNLLNEHMLYIYILHPYSQAKLNKLLTTYLQQDWKRFGGTPILGRELRLNSGLEFEASAVASSGSGRI